MRCYFRKVPFVLDVIYPFVNLALVGCSYHGRFLKEATMRSLNFVMLFALTFVLSACGVQQEGKSVTYSDVRVGNSQSGTFSLKGTRVQDVVTRNDGQQTRTFYRVQGGVPVDSATGTRTAESTGDTNLADVYCWDWCDCWGCSSCGFDLCCSGCFCGGCTEGACLN
jgi:hypothetical protein